LSEGTLADGLAPVGSATIIGVGHSIGGGLVVLQQARWGSYDAIAVLGYTHGA
jgi:tetrahydrodipicolinate N-succinyltransferase